ncbi:enoyl-CoA hydratase/isomerase family protein [Rhodococcus erythropolis]|uniref:enoyl-CoA hydratase/isomerase family protein n=1 Tax=Rhodococcus erythropolis TaxID=1833 RepID=UPI0037A7741E
MARSVSSGSFETIDIRIDDRVCLLTLNRPDAMNAADAVMHRELAEVWESIASEAAIRAVVITGAGRAFSAGGDLSRMIATQQDRSIQDEVFDEARRTVRGMLNLPQPIIAAVNGPAVGLGASLVTLCDLAVASEKAFLSDPHLGVGLVPADGAAMLWPLLMGSMKAKSYVFTGKRISASVALELGLVTSVVRQEDVVAEALAVARAVCDLPADAVQATKRMMNAAARAVVSEVLDDALDAERRSVNSIEHKRSVEALVARA